MPLIPYMPMLPPISDQTVAQVAESLMMSEDEEAIDQQVDEIAEQQPFLFAYLMAMGEGDFSEDERELLLFLGLATYQIMQTAQAEMSTVTEDHLDRLEQSNMNMLEQLAGESEAEFAQVAEKILQDHPQPAVLRFVLDTIQDETDDVVRPANQGILFIFVKIVVDCLQEAGGSA